MAYLCEASAGLDRLTGQVHHVSFRGRGSVLPVEVARAERLLARYLGPERAAWDPRFRTALVDPNTVFVKVEPDSVLVRDQSFVVERPAISG